MTRYLSLHETLVIGAASIPGMSVRDTSLLESALGRPAASMFGQDAYPDIHGKVAALLHSVVKNHPLHDGNKRLAWALSDAMFELNGYEPQYAVIDVYEFLLSLAASDEFDIDSIAASLMRWFRSAATQTVGPATRRPPPSP